MSPFRLLPSQRNTVLERIVQAGLTPAEFEWDTVTSSFAVDPRSTIEVDRLTHTPSECYFTFDWRTHPVSRVSAYSPTEEIAEGACVAEDWAGQLVDVSTWCACLRRELDAPDLWAELKTLDRIEATGPDDNTPFSETEVKQLLDALNKVQEAVENSDEISPRDKAAIKEDGVVLASASDRVGRKEWKLMLYGWLINLMLNKAVEPASVKFVWNLLVVAFGHLSRLLPP